MNESSARAERFEREAPAAPAYSWSVPQKPVAVHLPLEIMGRLEREALESYRSLTSRGSEIGGVLFGCITNGDPALVDIQAYELIPCEYANGPLYRLTEPELERLDRAIEQRRAPGLEPVGFFRSHTRKGLSLDSGDLELLDSRFTGPYQIALVVRPSAARSSLGGIFIREDGAIRAEASYLEFPFGGAREAGPSLSAAADRDVAGPRTAPAAPALPSPRPVPRAHIVPIATRREIMPMAPPVAAAPEPLVSAPEAETPAPALPAETPAPMLEAETPALEEKPAAPPPTAAVAGLGENVPASLSAAAAAVPRRSAPALETRTAHTEAFVAGPAAPGPRHPKPPARRSFVRWLWFGLGATAPAMMVAGLFFTAGMLDWYRPAMPAPAPDASLALRVERNASDILLTWNRDGDTIRRARKAVLTISDGMQEENVEMDLPQLRNGSIVYTPVASDVVFHMEVVVDGRAQPVSETVRVLRTRPSPMPDAPAPVSTAPAQPKPAGNPPQEARPAPARAFQQPEPLPRRLRAASPADLPDAPLVAAAPAGGTPPDLNLGGIVAIPVPPSPRAAEPWAPADKKAPAVGGQVRPAELIHRVEPQYPSLARKAGAGGRVEMTATIGADGRVKDARIASGNPLLRQAAIEAVRQWVYQPTLLDGQPVQSQTHVVLDFVPQQ